MSQSADQSAATTARRTAGPSPFDAWADGPLRPVFDLARQHADRLRHVVVDSRHLALALLQDPVVDPDVVALGVDPRVLADDLAAAGLDEQRSSTRRHGPVTDRCLTVLSLADTWLREPSPPPGLPREPARVLWLALRVGWGAQPPTDLLPPWVTPPSSAVSDPQEAGSPEQTEQTEQTEQPRAGAAEPAGASTAPPGPPQPGYAADVVGGADRLGMTDDVAALATLVAARDVTPPLSIGLFGHWGSGKSFFMDLLEARVRQLTTAAAAAARAGRPVAYCTRVRQVRFNAWHYADANLWAALTSHLFEELATGGARARAEQAGDRMAAVAAELDAGRAVLTRLQEQERAAAAAREGLAGLAREFARKQTTDVLDRVGAATGSPRARADADLLAGAVDVERLRAEAADVATGAGRVLEAWRVLAGRTRKGVATALLVLLVAAVAVTTWQASTLLPRVLAVAAPLLGWVALTAPLVRRVSAAAGVLNDRLQAVDAAQEAERARRAAQVEAARQRVEQLEGERDALRSGQLLQVARQRDADGTYTRQAGLVTQIRRDFAKMAEHAADPDGTGKGVDRVVLYVDDLDRCPAARVVEVLEAVHLLLALDLFVVVVAVDPRWLVRSLERRYEDMLGGGVAGDGRALPVDYLEKIFQIPFALRPMSHTGFGDLLDDLLASGEPASPADGPPARARSTHRGGAPEQGGRQREDGVGPPASTADAVGLRDTVTAVLAPDVRPSVLAITPAERAWLRTLSPLLRTPRAAKRFANVYRLLRATVPATEVGAFLDERRFRVCGFWAALVVGRPEVAAWLVPDVLAGADPLSDRLPAEVGAALQSLEDGDGPAAPPAHDLHAAWAARAARFSFRGAGVPAA